MGAQRLCCLNRYPSVLPGLAVAKTRTHHRDGTGCWGREMSKATIRERGGQERSEGKKRRREREKGRMEQGQGKGGQRSREEEERESGRTTRQGSIRKKG